MELVAFLGAGKGTWGQVAGVINHGDWDSIILIGNEFAKQFTVKKDFEFISISENSIMDLKEEIRERFNVTEEGESMAIIVEDNRRSSSTDDLGQSWYKRLWAVIIRN